MAYDPCNPVPNNTIPAGYTPHHYHHAVHHVVGRIKHTVHHKFPILGPPAHAPNPYGCEKHAIAGPGYGHGLPAAPLSKAAALGGAGAGLIALGGVGGLIGGFIPGIPRSSAKTTITGPGSVTGLTGPGSTNPVPPSVPTPPVTVVPPVTPTSPGTPPTAVPEPSALALFMAGAVVVILARMWQRRLDGQLKPASASAV